MLEIKGENLIRELNYVVIGRLGLVDAGIIECELQRDCKFTIDPNEHMIPEASVLAYFVNENGNIIHDTVVVKFKEATVNHVRIFSLNF